jgi:hypothetical protein
MRIRSGFVSNSSSTSFLIISQGDLDENAFLELMGVKPDSPIASLFLELFTDVIESSEEVDLAEVEPASSPETWFDSDRLSPVMIDRLKEARETGLKAYFGSLSSDYTMVQSFFCTDAFEVENEKIYFNYLECAW